MDLTSLYRMVSAEAPNIPEQMLKGAAGQAALQQADEQLMANKRLRELYASGNQPSMQDLMSVDPRLGVEMQQAQFKNMLEAGQIEKLNREKQEHEAKVYAQHMSPIAQDYFDDIKRGMSEQQAEYKFRSSVGQAQADIEQRFGIKPQADFTQFSPIQIAQRSHSLGVDIPHLKEIEEQQKNQFAMQQKMSPGYSDIAGRTEAGPYGTRYIPPAPLPGSRQLRGTGLGGAPAGEIPTPSIEFEGRTYAGPEFAKAIMAEQDPVKRAKMNEYIDASMASQRANIPGSQFVTPEQEAQMRVEEKGKEAGIAKSAQIAAEEQAADKKALDTYFRGRPPEQVRELIKQSIEGDLETGLARIGKTIGVAVPGGSPTAALKVITQQLAATTPFAPGSQSDVEYKARLQKIGDPASDEPIQNRLAALDEFYRDQEAFVAQKYQPESVEDILDKRQQGFISEDTARKLYKKLKSKSGKL